jgi:hypothetical protein
MNLHEAIRKCSTVMVSYLEDTSVACAPRSANHIETNAYTTRYFLKAYIDTQWRQYVLCSYGAMNQKFILEKVKISL